MLLDMIIRSCAWNAKRRTACSVSTVNANHRLATVTNKAEEKRDVSSFDRSRSDQGGFACTHPLYLILELGNAVHMRQLLQHCAARQRCFPLFWTKCRRRKSLASERAHENDEIIAEHRQTTEAEHGLHSLRQDNKCAT